MENKVAQIVKELEIYAPKRKIVLRKSYFDEFRKTDTYKKGEIYKKAFRESNSYEDLCDRYQIGLNEYAEAKQHNII